MCVLQSTYLFIKYYLGIFLNEVGLTTEKGKVAVYFDEIPGNKFLQDVMPRQLMV